MTPTEPIVQREAVLGRIGLWQSSNVFLLVGAPGTGKSEIARQAAEAFGAGYAHWCDAQDDATLSPLRFVRSLALALADRYPGYAQRLTREVRPDIVIHAAVEVHTLESGARAQAVVIESLQISDMPARAAFDRLIRLPLEGIEGDGEPFLVVVDAIEESLGFHPTDHLVDLLAHSASCDGLRFLLTSRSGESRVSDRLGVASLDLDHHDDGGLLEYTKLRLGALSDSDRSFLAERLAAAGNFLYVHHVLNDLDKLPPGTDVTALALPNSLTDVYRKFLTRTLAPDRRDQDWMTRFRPVLGIVAVGRGQDGLPIPLIATAAGFPQSTIMDVLLACGQFIRLTSGRPDDMQARIYHRSFQDFLLTDDTFTVFPAEAHAAIARALDAERWRAWTTQQRIYGLAYLPMHLSEGGATASLIDLAHDQDFLAAQRRQHPDQPSIDVTTVRLALNAACAGSDPVLIAGLVTLAMQLLSSEASTPLQILESHGLAAALTATQELDADLRVGNELLLCVALIESEKMDGARHVARELLARRPGRLTGRVEGCAALMLAVLCMSAPELGQNLAARLLNIWSLKYLVRHLLDLKEYRSAVRVAGSIGDMAVRYLTFFGIGEHLLNGGEIDQALILLGSVGESVDPDNEPGPERTLWWVFPEVVSVVGLSLVMKGDVQRGKAVFGRASGRKAPEQTDYGPQLQAAVGFAAWRAGNKKAARHALADAETRADQLAEGRDAGAHLRAFAWVFIGKVYLWCGLRDDARRAAGIAAGYLPPLATMKDLPFHHHPVHDDAFHGPCIQGTYLDLACLAGRAGDIPTAMALATTLAEFGSGDAVEAFAVIATAPEASANDLERARQESAQVIDGLDARVRVATIAHLAWGSPETGWEGAPFDGPMVSMLDAVLGPRHEKSDAPKLRQQPIGTGVASADLTQCAIDSREDSTAAEGPTIEELRAVPDEPTQPIGPAFDYVEGADRIYARARAWARVGDHEEAMRQFELAMSWEDRGHMAWESFQAMARVPKTTDIYADEDDDVASQRVHRLCELASVAAKAADREGVTIFLAEAEARVRQINFEGNRSSTAVHVAVTAARCDALSDLATILPLITIRRQDFFSEIWLSYCDAHAGQASMVLPVEVRPLLTEMSASPEAAVSACAGLATLYPAHAVAISELIDLGGYERQAN